MTKRAVTNAKIHRITEVLAKIGRIRYFTDIYRCSAYGFYLDIRLN